MTGRRKIAIAAIAVVGLGSLIAGQISRSNRGIEVRVDEVETRDLIATVVASGENRTHALRGYRVRYHGGVSLVSPSRKAITSGAAQLLLRIDPTQFQAAVQQAEAALSSARASELQAIANRDQAKRALDRAIQLRQMDSNTEEALENARVSHEVAVAMAESQGHQVVQAQARVREATEQLAKTTLVSPMDGQITRLAVEEGEVALASTFSRETGLLMTVSDLSVIQVNVLVDETDVVQISDGDSTEITIDAFPDTTFSGTSPGCRKAPAGAPPPAAGPNARWITTSRSRSTTRRRTCVRTCRRRPRSSPTNALEC